MKNKLYGILSALVAAMLVDIEDAEARELAVEAKEDYAGLIAQAVWNEFLGTNAELVVIDPMILEKEE